VVFQGRGVRAEVKVPWWPHLCVAVVGFKRLASEVESALKVSDFLLSR